MQTHFARKNDTESSGGLISQATVLDFDSNQRTARVYIDRMSGIQDVYASLATPYDIILTHGDKVIVAGEGIGALFIIAVLSKKLPMIVRSPNGAYAMLHEADDSPCFQIFSDSGELVVEYDPETRKTKIFSGPGDVDLKMPEGNMRFQSSKSISFEAESIHLKGKEAFNAIVEDNVGRSASSFSMGIQQAKLGCRDLRISASRTHLLSDEFKIITRKVFGNIVDAVINADRLETRAQCIINKVKNIYQTVENLSQLKTGRLKTLIRSTYHLKSRNTVLKSEEDFKVKAERINLG